MSFSKYGRRLILSHAFAGGKMPSMFLVAYRKTGAGVKEVFGGGYERVPLSTSLFVPGEGKEVTLENKDDILFPVAHRNWGEVVAVGIVDEAGEEIAYHDISEPPDITIGKRLRLPAGSLVLVLEDLLT